MLLELSLIFCSILYFRSESRSGSDSSMEEEYGVRKETLLHGVCVHSLSTYCVYCLVTYFV